MNINKFRAVSSEHGYEKVAARSGNNRMHGQKRNSSSTNMNPNTNTFRFGESLVNIYVSLFLIRSSPYHPFPIVSRSKFNFTVKTKQSLIKYTRTKKEKWWRQRRVEGKKNPACSRSKASISRDREKRESDWATLLGGQITSNIVSLIVICYVRWFVCL